MCVWGGRGGEGEVLGCGKRLRAKEGVTPYGGSPVEETSAKLKVFILQSHVTSCCKIRENRVKLPSGQFSRNSMSRFQTNWEKFNASAQKGNREQLAAITTATIL